MNSNIEKQRADTLVVDNRLMRDVEYLGQFDREVAAMGMVEVKLVRLYEMEVY